MGEGNFTHLNLNVFEASWPILIKFYVYHHWGAGKAALVLGQIDLGTLDSGERSLPFGLLVDITNLHENVLLTKFSILAFSYNVLSENTFQPAHEIVVLIT